MAPIKFEEHIKEQLEERRISPSPKSWDKLNARLNKAENRQKTTKKWWFGIAALLVVALSVGGFILKSDESVPIESQMVNSSSEKSIKSDETTPPISNTVPETEIASENNQEAKEKEEVSIKNTRKVQQQSVEISRQEVVQVAQIKQEKAKEKKQEELSKIDKINPEFINPTATEKEYIAENKSKIQQKLKETLKVLENSDTENATDAEVNALLLAAAAELEQDYKKEYKNSYSAEALLAEVEGELDRSFRDKIFDLLKEGYSKAKNAVALE